MLIVNTTGKVARLGVSSDGGTRRYGDTTHERLSPWPHGVLDATVRSDASVPPMFRQTRPLSWDKVAEIRTLAVFRSTKATPRRQVMIANFLAMMRGDTGTHHIKIRAIRLALGDPSPYTTQTLSHEIILIVSGFQSSNRRNQSTL
jgi:hypothetical protein